MTRAKRKQPAKVRRAIADDDPPAHRCRAACARPAPQGHGGPGTRYLLVSVTLPGFSLYYRVHDDAWSFDDPSQATLFKRRAAAKAIHALLRPGVHIVRCTVDDEGRLELSSLTTRKIGRTRLAVLPSWRRKRTARQTV